ncbi:hypothetical protein DUNSADRAFT_18662 [Dunaliella salina]|uniref:Uncharacterized protein n=1 Tax=Dunaliella salina TaxID=3046 RepID=A0ABQ7GYU7_DUNSA|nr:hypothetical protein DUNSADRAFT_18662 [Dunaliella salina]|eukprot:KAF5839784.1 hypothetical protein DUNSADRAFT_18662 [Dunaliella salina]
MMENDNVYWQAPIWRSKVAPIQALETPLRTVVEHVIALYTAATVRQSSSAACETYSRHAMYDSPACITFSQFCILALSALLRSLSSEVKVHAAPVTVYEPDPKTQTFQLVVPMLHRWYGPFFITRLLRFLGRSDPAWTLHFTTSLLISTITGKVVAHQDRVREFPRTPTFLRLILGACIPALSLGVL